MRDRTTVVVLVLATVVLVAGGWFGYLTLFRSDDARLSTQATRAPMQTRPFVSKPGGFSLRVPAELQATRNGRTARFSSRDKTLVVSVGTSGPGPVEAASARLVQRLRGTYSRARVLGRRTDRVDGRRALTTYGRASNADKVLLRFVVVVVPGKPHTYALTVFTSSRDARRVVQLVDRLAGTFHVRRR